MRTVVATILAAVLFPAAASGLQDASSPQQRFQRALELHDTGDFDGAIAIYRSLLAALPDNDQVKYELTFSTFAKGDIPEAIRLASDGAARKGPNQARYLELLGNAYDASDRAPEAIAVYKRGIKLVPADARLRYNLGITYFGQKKYNDARENFEEAIARNPDYASPQFAIGNTYLADGYRVPAILAYGRFLSLERTTERAAVAARHLQELLGLGVTKTGEGKLQVQINPASKKDLGDFSTLEMMAAIAVAGSQLDDKAPTPDFERAAAGFAVFLTMLSETSDDDKRGFVARTYLPFYTAVVRAGHGPAFAHASLVPLKLGGTDEWLESHKAELAALEQWLRASARN